VYDECVTSVVALSISARVSAKLITSRVVISPCHKEIILLYFSLLGFPWYGEEGYKKKKKKKKKKKIVVYGTY
jgi:hypothetical protein